MNRKSRFTESSLPSRESVAPNKNRIWNDSSKKVWNFMK